LGEQKYRQLRMHLSAALRLLGELAADTSAAAANVSNASDVSSETVTAMTTITERLRALPRQQRAIAIGDIPRVKSRKRSSR
jgi:hypothetical protein